MCSVQDGDVPLKKAPSDKRIGRLCMKCKEEQAILITRVNDAFCRACFQVYVTHKFRATIGKTKLVRDGEMVLVGYSDGQSSSALLHLIQEGLSQRAHKKLRFKPGIIYIDEGGCIGDSADDCLTTSEAIRTILDKTGFPYYIKSLEEVYKEDQDKLKATLADMKSVSAKEDFIRSLRHKLLTDVAKEHGYSKVMLGNCGSQLSVRLLTDMSTGRGSHAAMTTAFADKRNSDLFILRPLREFSSKEVAMYNNLHNVDTVFIPTITTKGDVGISIEHLTESFVTGLQSEYPSTVSNIMRTGEKLDGGVEKIDRLCTLCQGPLDTNVGESSALSAVEFSQTISRRKESGSKGDNCAGTEECCGEGDGSCLSNNKNDRPTLKEIVDSLCYGCRLVVKDMTDAYQLPEYVIQDVSTQTRRSNMKKTIGEFLLEES